MNVLVWRWLWQYKPENSESSGQDPNGFDLFTMLLVIAAFIVIVAVTCSPR